MYNERINDIVKLKGQLEQIFMTTPKIKIDLRHIKISKYIVDFLGDEILISYKEESKQLLLKYGFGNPDAKIIVIEESGNGLVFLNPTLGKWLRSKGIKNTTLDFMYNKDEDYFESLGPSRHGKAPYCG